MNRTLRTLKLTIGSLAIIIALAFTLVPMPQAGLRTASAMTPSNDFGSKALFKDFCKTLGGEFTEGKYSTACVLPNGKIYVCDETAKNCVFLAKTDLFKVGIKLELINGTLTAIETGGAGTTTTTGVSRTATTSSLTTKDR